MEVIKNMLLFYYPALYQNLTSMIFSTPNAIRYCLFLIGIFSYITTIAQTTPSLTVTPPKAITVECSYIPAPTNPIATTTCKNSKIVFTFSESKTLGSCPESYILTRTWIATDSCKNSATVSQKITVKDSKAPFIGLVVANITVECSNIPIAVKPTVIDNCSKSPSVTVNDKIEVGLCTDSYRIIRQWTATDNCANKSTKTQIISVLDKTKPFFVNIPKNITVDCSAIPTSIPPTATDNCDKLVNITFKESIVASTIAATYILKREWTASDNCGNTNIATQLITVKDSKAPKFTTLPPNITVSCSQIPLNTSPGVVDNCTKIVKITTKETILNGTCSDSYVLKREWTATDESGNTAILTQNISVQDITPPSIFGIPSNITMSCSQALLAPSKTVTSLDNCDKQVDISFKEIKVNGICTDNYIIKREWTATDNCNNKLTRTQSITIRDNTAPNFTTILQNLTVDCSKIPSVATLYASDNCDKQIDITFKEIKTAGNCSNNFTLTRTWVATDNCSNSKTISQIIFVQDNVAPKLVNIPINITLDCKGEIPNMPTISATDNCSTELQVLADEKTTTSQCTKTITRTWTATDACGNSSSATQIIKIEDTTPPYPVVTPPASITLACGAAIPVAPAIMFKDKCTETVTVSYAEEIINSGNTNCPIAKIIRRWTAKDTCGNATVFTQTVLIGIQSIGKEAQVNNEIIAQNNATIIPQSTQNELVYPNPTDGALFIRLSEKTDEIRLTDELGRIIYVKENLLAGTLNLDLSIYENGVYNLQIKVGNTQTTQRVVLLKR